MLHIAVALWLLFLSMYRGILSKFRTYQSTMYYIIFSNLYYEYIENLFERDLWEFSKTFINLFITEFFYTFVTLPCLAFLFLDRYPEQGSGRIFYHYAKWVILSFLVSCTGYMTGYIFYQHGYSLITEFLFYCMMYPMLYAHFKRPKTTLVLSFFITLAFLVIFRYRIV